MKGYLNNPKATADTMLEGNWLRTGDIGYYDKEENLFIVDRLKELIKVKGFQVPPAELENLLRSHPEIADAGVIGVPHDKTGEAPRAYVIRKAESNLTQEAVQEYVKREAAEYKQLSGGVRFVEELPKAPSGKIVRRMLVANYDKETAA
jgi:4-coumarate--CoA ligase